MKNDLRILRMSPLFKGVKEQDMEEMISCLNGQVKTYGKNERILTEAETLKRVGVILDGCVQVESEDVFGEPEYSRRSWRGANCSGPRMPSQA